MRVSGIGPLNSTALPGHAHLGPCMRLALETVDFAKIPSII